MAHRDQKSSEIFTNSSGDLRSGWRILIYLVGTTVCCWIVVAAYNAAAMLLLAPGREKEILEFVLLCSAALFTAFLMLKFVDRRPFSALGFALHGRVRIEIRQGIILGFAMVTCVFLVEWSAGWISVVHAGWSATEALGLLAYYAVLFGLAGAFEEIAARGYAFQALIQGTGKPAAVGIASLAFGLVHATNPHASTAGVVNTMLAGVMLSAAYLKTRSLWLPTSLHMSWNLTMGFVYGFPLSGMSLGQTLFRLSQHGPIWLTGGEYGPEAGAVATLILALSALFIWRSALVRPSPLAVALWNTGSVAAELDERIAADSR